MLFRILLGIDLVAAAVVAYFFVIGLGDGSISSFNGHLWAGLLLGVAAVFAGGLALRRAGRPVAAALVLAILAAPALFFSLFMLTVVLSGARWN